MVYIIVQNAARDSTLTMPTMTPTANQKSVRLKKTSSAMDVRE